MNKYEELKCVKKEWQRSQILRLEKETRIIRSDGLMNIYTAVETKSLRLNIPNKAYTGAMRRFLYNKDDLIRPLYLNVISSPSLFKSHRA